MALLDRNREPTAGELRLFGILMAAFGGLVGMLGRFHNGSWTIAMMIWSAALLLCVSYYAVPSAQHMVFRVWMTVVYPIGWLISHTLLAIMYYLVLTPIGLTLRLCGHDPLQREPDHSATTHWAPLTTHETTGRYFQQY